MPNASQPIGTAMIAPNMPLCGSAPGAMTVLNASSPRV
jgi:hypothetical protein